MKKIILLTAIGLLAAIFLAPAFAADKEPAVAPNLVPQFDLYFQTYVYGANDRDFDRTKLLYQPNGQTVGFVLTTFRPGLTWTPANILTLRYQFELGDNIWGRNDLYSDYPTPQTQPLFRHKEVWVDVHTPANDFGGRIGYMYAYDPTHLVLDAHMGMAQTYFNFGADRLTIEAGQFPNGVTSDENQVPTNDTQLFSDSNFEHQNYIFGAFGRFPAGDSVAAPGVFFNWNRTQIDRSVGVLSGVCNFITKPAGNMDLNIDLAVQWGKEKHAALDNSDVTLIAGAAQANFEVYWRWVGLRYSALAFTGSDQNREGRRVDTGFQFSGWSRADTMMLTLNWLHDLYNNIDEAAAAQGAGFAMLDQRFSVNANDDVKLFLTVGAGMTMSRRNTGNSDYLGTEGELGMQWTPLPDHLKFHLIAGGMLPGRAASELINTINKKATDPIFQGQAGITVLYGDYPWFGVR